MVETSKDPIKDTHVHNKSFGITSVDSVVNGVGIIGRGGPRDISRGTSIISSNVITHVLTNSSDMILKSNSFPFNPLKAQTIVLAPLTEPFLTSDRDVRTTSAIG